MSKDWKIIHFEDPYEAGPDTLASDTGLSHEGRSVGIIDFSGRNPRILAVSSDPFILTAVELRGVLDWATSMRPDLVNAAGWIPVEQKIPEDTVGEKTLLLWDGKRVICGGFQESADGADEPCWYENDYGSVVGITHWKPLPTGPIETD